MAKEHQWKKGQSGNPNGRPRGSKNRWSKELDKAIDRVEREKGTGILVMAVRMAYENPKMMAAVLKKILPDKRYIEADVRSIHDDWIKRLEEDDTAGQGGISASQDQERYAILF